jgi:toxin ParE1/3/4
VKLLWTRDAIADRRAIYDYIETGNPRAALDMDGHFERKAEQLVAHPMIGRTGRVQGTRELVMPPNYLLIYDVGKETVRLLRVLHSAQQWPPNLK